MSLNQQLKKVQLFVNISKELSFLLFFPQTMRFELYIARCTIYHTAHKTGVNFIRKKSIICQKFEKYFVANEKLRTELL